MPCSKDTWSPPIRSDDLLRVNVVGNSGSGKSTFARQLATALGTKYVEMDCLFHGPNWKEPEVEVFRERIREALTGERWVLDGNYHSKTCDLKWDRATTIVWVDTPFVRNMWQSFRRAIRRAWTQQELWPGTGNRETFRKSFLSRDSIILWALNSHYPLRKRYQAVRDDPKWEHIRFVQLRGKSDAARLLEIAAKCASG